MAKSKKDLLGGFKPGTDIDDLNTKANTETTFRMLRVDTIHAHPGNREIDRGFVEELARSIKSDGLGNPILVRPEGSGYQLVSGHHRWEAKKLLCEQEPDEPRHRMIEAIVRDMSDDETDVLLLATNVYVNPITAEERRASLARLGRTVAELREVEPEKYKGVRTAKIIADKVRESGGSVSERTVYRDLAASREDRAAAEAERSLSEEWRAEIHKAESKVKSKDVVAIAKMTAIQQRAALKAYRNGGAEGIRAAIESSDQEAKAARIRAEIRKAERSMEKLMSMGDCELVGKSEYSRLKEMADGIC